MMVNIKITEKDLINLDDQLKPLGLYVSSLKKSHLRRRLRMRLMRTGHTNVSDYLEYLYSDEDEQKELRLAFSINVTRFFRNIKVFEFIENDVLKELRLKSRTTKVKIWSAGCADGAEPYTLAIICSELKMNSENVEIFGTDYNHSLLNVAKKGIFPVSYLSEIPPKFEYKYFNSKTPKFIHVSHKLKKFITFKFHNLTSDTKGFPISDFDLIICRNVLIYFSVEQKDKTLKRFYQALKPGGFLVLGMAEILPTKYREKFTIYNATNRVYRKN